MMTSDADSHLRSAALAIIDELVGRYTLLEQRVVALEAALASPVTPKIVEFAQSRPSWTVQQLAGDLGVHENTIRNWIALPTDTSRHLDSFQPGGTGPHFILPEHVAKWVARDSLRR